jgi:hypothetical protein
MCNFVQHETALERHIMKRASQKSLKIMVVVVVGSGKKMGRKKVSKREHLRILYRCDESHT